MLGKQSPHDILGSYRKRRQIKPTVITGLAIFLVVFGVVIIGLWFGGGGFAFNPFSREPTTTSTLPPTPVLSPTPTIPPTETPTPTLTVSPTPSGPFEYQVREFDNCWDIANRFEVDLEALLAINNFEDGTCPIYPGQTIRVPAPGTVLPTSTPVPPDLPVGTRIEYTIRAGDSLLSISERFNTTIEDLLAQNQFDNPDNIPPGRKIIVRVNLVTPMPTFAPTSTRAL